MATTATKFEEWKLKMSWLTSSVHLISAADIKVPCFGGAHEYMGTLNSQGMLSLVSS